MVLYLPQYIVHQFKGMLECPKDLLCITQPVCMDLQHGMEVTHIRQMLLQFPL